MRDFRRHACRHRHLGLTARGELAAQFGDGAAPVPAAIRAANNSIRRRLETGRRGNPRRERPGRSRGSRTPPAAAVSGTSSTTRPATWASRSRGSKQPAFAGGKATTPQDALAAMGSYNSYWGSFAVNDARGIVTHQTFGALQPGVRGDQPGAQFTISGNRLTLRPPTCRQRRSADADLGTRARPAEPDADASEVDRLLEADLARTPQCERRTAVVESRA